MSEIYGTNDPAFDSVRELMQKQLSSGEELGLSLAVNIDGKDVLDLWGGHADVLKTQPWTKDTITLVWSCSKVVTNLAAMLLVDRGQLDVNEKVATYWPEFAANGKENITVAHVLSHSSGIPAWETPVTYEELCDNKVATEKLAQQAPWWTPGEKSGYQLSNQGHMVGEVIRRITGKPLEQFVADEITRPLDADFQYGVPEDQWHRTAELIPPAALPIGDLDPNSIVARAIMGSPFPAQIAVTPTFRKAVIGATNGFSNARALARIGSIVSLGGTVDGKRIVDPTTIDKLLEEQIQGQDLVTPEFVRFGLGVGLPDYRTRPWIPEGDLCFWGGWGGSIMIMDRERRMTISYAMNRMSGISTIGNANTEAYVKAIYEIVNNMSA
ncbi:beta-lactamase domain-containing protein 2 [Penicillium frequentans]|nr:beta-lactamase domain-containing protein 2 [Penicillium glabrum]